MPINEQHCPHIFFRLKALQRTLISLLFPAVIFLFIRNLHLGILLTSTLLWVSFAFSFICVSWTVFFKLPVEEIIKIANKEDGGRLFVLSFTLITSFASMFAVVLLMTSDKVPQYETLSIIIALAGMTLSWILVHTLFTFHYAHLYYFEGKDDTPDDEALDFPGGSKPDYLDFAYFSFIIGMTFQVSDVQINSRQTRRTALAHSLLAFILNTFVVALTINFIAGLRH